jgi:hypothetical protein
VILTLHEQRRKFWTPGRFEIAEKAEFTNEGTKQTETNEEEWLSYTPEFRHHTTTFTPA